MGEIINKKSTESCENSKKSLKVIVNSYTKI